MTCDLLFDPHAYANHICHVRSFQK